MLTPVHLLIKLIKVSAEGRPLPILILLEPTQLHHLVALAHEALQIRASLPHNLVAMQAQDELRLSPH